MGEWARRHVEGRDATRRGGGDVEVVHPARGDEHAALERADEQVVRLDAASQRAAEIVGVLGEHSDAVVELAAERQQLTRVLLERRLLPHRADAAHRRDEGARRGEHDVTLHRLLEQTGVGIERGRENGVARHEADDERGRLRQCRPVTLRGERVDVRAQLLGVAPQRGAAGAFVEVRLLRREERTQRRLGIDDERTLARQMDDDVGAHVVTGVVAPAPLLVEVAATQHARQLEDAPQLRFAPLPAHARGVERTGQR